MAPATPESGATPNSAAPSSKTLLRRLPQLQPAQPAAERPRQPRPQVGDDVLAGGGPLGEVRLLAVEVGVVELGDHRRHEVVELDEVDDHPGLGRDRALPPTPRSGSRGRGRRRCCTCRRAPRSPPRRAGGVESMGGREAVGPTEAWPCRRRGTRRRCPVSRRAAGGAGPPRPAAAARSATTARRRCSRWWAGSRGSTAVSSLRCLWSKPSSTSPTMAFSSVRLMTMPVVSSTSPDDGDLEHVVVAVAVGVRALAEHLEVAAPASSRPASSGGRTRTRSVWWSGRAWSPVRGLHGGDGLGVALLPSASHARATGCSASSVAHLRRAPPPAQPPRWVRGRSPRHRLSGRRCS